MQRLRTLLLLSILIAPNLVYAAESKRDSLWYKGHEFRQWIYDQNSIGDQNSNLDPEISFTEGGRIRVHSKRVYFYDNIDLGIQIAKETGYPLAFYLFNHTCKTCLYRLPELYGDPSIVEKSRHFVNVYVELPKYQQKIGLMGMMNASLTVQFFLPNMRRLRVVDDAEKKDLLTAYSQILDYWESLSPDERLDRELELKKIKSSYK